MTNQPAEPKPGTVLDDLAHLPQQITASADRIEQLKQQLADERTRRDDLIGTAVDQAGLLVVEAARLARVTATHVNRILASQSAKL
jgi:hypothetical protein